MDLGYRNITFKKDCSQQLRGETRAGELPLDCKNQEPNNTSLTLYLCELVTVSSYWRGTLIWYLLCFGDTFYWVKIAAVRKSVSTMKFCWPSGQRWDKGVRLRNEDKRGNVRGGGQYVRVNFLFLMSWIFFLVPRKDCCVLSQERCREVPLAALCHRPDRQCQQSSPVAARERLRAVPDLPNYSLWSLAPEKAKGQHFLWASSAKVHSAFSEVALEKVFCGEAKDFCSTFRSVTFILSLSHFENDLGDFVELYQSLNLYSLFSSG